MIIYNKELYRIQLVPIRMLYVLKYQINGALFRRIYTERAARDCRADVLMANGITVTCSTKRKVQS